MTLMPLFNQEHLKQFRFKPLFNELGWDLPTQRQPYSVAMGDASWLLDVVAIKKGVQVLHCRPDEEGRIPDYATRQKIERKITPDQLHQAGPGWVVVAVLARPVNGATLPSEWTEPVAQGRLTVVSVATTAARLTSELAIARNQLVAQLATDIVVAHASPGGALAGLLAQWQVEKQRLVTVLGSRRAQTAI